MIKHNIIFNSFSPWTFDIAKAKGSTIWTTEGKELLDFTSGWNVANLGWNNQEIQDVIISQAKKSINASLESSQEVQYRYAQELISVLPKGLQAIGRATGGTEANEEALKTARAYTKRKKIIGFKDSYHGQSFATMALGWQEEYVSSFAPLVPEFIQIDYPNIYRTKKSQEDVLQEFIIILEALLKKEDVAAIVTESGILTGWGTTYIAPSGYLSTVRKLTKKYGTLLILDEVGTGFSRTGKLFGLQHENVIPDILTLAKGASNGAAPLGIMVTTEEIANKTCEDTNLTSTFGWVPLACAVGRKVLEIHQRDTMWEKAQKDGDYIKSHLKQELKNNPFVGDIRGLGMEIGIDFVKDKESKTKNKELLIKVVKKAFEKGLHLNLDWDSNIQLMPPLTTTKSELNRGIEILINAITTCSKN